MIEEIRMAGKASGRMERINEEVRRELSEILRDEVKDVYKRQDYFVPPFDDEDD